MDDYQEKECAYINLRGAAQRLLIVLNARSERNYEIAINAVNRLFKKYESLDKKGNG